MLKKWLMGFMVLAGAVSAAQAGFFIVDTQDKKPAASTPQAPTPDASRPQASEKAPPAGSAVYVDGELVDAPPAVGYGKRVPLHVAVRQIAPRDYTVITAGLSAEQIGEPVDWRGGDGKNWAETLNAVLLEGRRAVARIDTAHKRITLLPAEDARPGGASVWRIKAGDRVSETLAGWGRRAGWQAVVWEAPEIVAEMDIAFSGEFVEAVTQIIDALSAAGTPVRALVYEGNKVIRVMEKR